MIHIAEQVFMKVDEVAAELGVSNSYAYKLIRELNKELKAAGCIIINGRIDRRFFHEHLYATQKRKVLKRVCFGVRNFSRFRNRILHCAA